METKHLVYNTKPYLKFETDESVIFIKKDDISMVILGHSPNNQLKATITLKGIDKFAHIVNFHKNNYREYLELCDVVDYKNHITEEEWHKTMKVSYK